MFRHFNAETDFPLLRLHAAEAAAAGRASLPGLLLSAFCLLLSLPARAVEHFPPPDFTNGYTLPVTATPAPRADMFAYIDVGVLVAALLLASYLVLWKRSRRCIAALAIFSLAYFGFYRHGCVCPIGVDTERFAEHRRQQLCPAGR